MRIYIYILEIYHEVKIGDYYFHTWEKERERDRVSTKVRL
jgi:hypothetical protein